MSEDGGVEVDWLIGQVIGNYRILFSIGRGGMGSVYLATHEVLGRQAAVKVLLPEYTGNAELVTRFFREARATAQLRHHAFVEIFDSGRLGDGSAYLVMEYLRGESLAGYLRRVGPLPIDDALAIARDIAEGVGFAHNHGIVHRDLKPDNVFLTVNSDDEDARSPATAVKILDFGVAKLLGDPDNKETAARTRAGAVLGTPLYMAPEQCRGSGEIDQRADLYALGCILHEMISGLPPFPLAGFGELLSAHLMQPPPPLSQMRRDVPEPVESLVLAMLAKNPADRPPDMMAVAAAVAAIRAAPDAVRDGAGSVAKLAVMVPAPVAAAVPGEPSGPSQPISWNARGPSSSPGRTPPPGGLPRTTPAPAPLLRTTPAPGHHEPRAEASAGGTRLLPTADDPVAVRRSSADRRRRSHPGASTSTLRGSAAEAHTERTYRGEPAGARRIGVIIAASLIGGAAVIAAVVKLTSKPDRPAIEATRETADEPSRPMPGRDLPPLSPPPPPAVEPPPPPVAAPPPVTGAVTVKITSDPPGASVVDTRTGEMLGKTPFARELPRAPDPVTLSLRKGGYRAKDVSVSLDRDNDLDVKLERKAGATSAGKPNEDDEYRKL